MTAKDLKNALLQEAVMGKLVPQIASEGNARDLLNEIKNSHTDLQISTKSAGVKSDLRSKSQIRVTKKEVAPITDEEVPFDIPESWCWCRLGEIIELLSGRDLEPSAYNSVSKGIPYMTGASNFENGELIVNRWTDNPVTISNKGDLLITCKGTIGELAFNKVGDVHIARQIMAIRKSDHIDLSFLKYFLMGRIDVIQKQAKSMIPGISREVMLNVLFPLPPLAEQKRIVAAIEKFMPLIEEYGKKESALNLLNAQIASLTKKAILQEAVQGRLVPQIATEGNAKDLLAEIKKSHTDLQISTKSAGSDKKNSDLRSKSQIRVTKKELPPITQEEIPFDIPDSWCWCRLGEIAFIARGGSPRPINEYLTNDSDGYNWIKISDTDKDGKYINSTKQKIKKEGLYKTRLIHKGDFLLTNSMSFGRPYISNIEGCIHDGWLVFSFINELINPDFIYYLLSSSFIYESFLDSAAGAVVKNLNTDKVIETLIPLPPLAEQKRIVSAIEKLLPLCKKLGQ